MARGWSLVLTMLEILAATIVAITVVVVIVVMHLLGAGTILLRS